MLLIVKLIEDGMKFNSKLDELDFFYRIFSYQDLQGQNIFLLMIFTSSQLNFQRIIRQTQLEYYVSI